MTLCSVGAFGYSRGRNAPFAQIMAFVDRRPCRVDGLCNDLLIVQLFLVQFGRTRHGRSSPAIQDSFSQWGHSLCSDAANARPGISLSNNTSELEKAYGAIFDCPDVVHGHRNAAPFCRIPSEERVHGRDRPSLLGRLRTCLPGKHVTNWFPHVHPVGWPFAMVAPNGGCSRTGSSGRTTAAHAGRSRVAVSQGATAASLPF